jgi:dTDP-4-dehydrorhamnose reductase
MMRTLVFGSSGQLGQCLKKVAVQRGLEGIQFPETAVSNILDVESIRALFEQERPHYVVNCAAYTAVDKAEEEINLARQVNSHGPANLARLCKEFGSVLIHISTDFVFDGIKASLLTEEDATEPVNTYGLTKLEGERAIQNTLDQHFIIRTSWLYSEFGNNFVKTMLRLGAEREQLNVICDQVGTPTYAIDLASCIIHIIQNRQQHYGLYHFSNEGVSSWYDFAHTVFKISGMKTTVVPILGKDYVTKAKRPAFSVMDKSKIKLILKVEIPHWRDSLQKCIENLNKEISIS